jgi:hypothetical protein
MNASLRLVFALSALIALSAAQVALGQTRQVIWQLGAEDGGQTEFSQEGSSNDPPGSPEAQDDDFYFAGTYPEIGVVSQTEPFKNFDRALTPGDFINRIHFNLDANTAKPTNELKLTIALCCLGAADGTPGTHDVVMRFNGHEFFNVTELTESMLVEQVVKGSEVDAQVGENIVEIERTGGSGSSWVQFDYLRLEIPAADADNDQIPDEYERRYPAFLSPNNPADAALDQDGDTLTNLDEYKRGTDPSKADTDGDGLNDGAEINTHNTDPLAADSDRDTLTDAEEINQYLTNPNSADTDGDTLSDSQEIKTTKTDPTKADTDGDGASDALELKLGSNPLDAADKPVPFTPLWMLGIADNSQAEFTQEVGGSPEAPGSAEALDDDYYFAGSYPDTIGDVAVDEDPINFERALTDGNVFSRIHFNLAPSQVKTNSEYLLTFPLIQPGSVAGPSTHDISFRFNGTEFHKETGITSARTVEQIVKAPDVKAVAGENVIELERTGGSGSSWIQFDYIKAEYRENTGAPVGRPNVSLARSGNNLTVQWSPAGGTLESTPSLSGAPVWTAVGAANPATIQIAPGNRFYRVRR